ncbi:MAG: CHASE domain-containing protein [Pseudomonadota bacterium]
MDQGLHTGHAEHEPMRRWHTLTSIAVLALVYFLLARSGLRTPNMEGSGAPYWPPSGVALAALLLFGRRLWPGVLLGAFCASIAVFASARSMDAFTLLRVSCAIGAGAAIEALLGAFLLKRLAGPYNQLGELQNIHKFALVTLLSCAIGAGIGTLALLGGGVVSQDNGWATMSIWWLGDVARVVIGAPVLMSWYGFRRPRWTLALALETATWMLVVLVLVALVFGQRFDAEYRWLPFLILPVVAGAAHRHGLRGASVVCLLVAVGAVAGSVRGLGPFAAGSQNEMMVHVGSFIALSSFVGLILCADLSERRRRTQLGQGGGQLIAHWTTLFIGLALTVFMWNLIAGGTARRAQERFDSLADNVPQRIARRMQNYEQGLRSVQALFRASHRVERAEFHAFIDGLALEQNFPGVLGIGYASVIGADQLETFERQARADGMPEFALWPPGARVAYAPLLFLDPPNDANLRAIGFDMYVDPTRRAAMEMARDSGRAAVSGKVILKQEASALTPAGVLMYLPVYRNGAPVASVLQRRAALQGYVSTPYHAATLFQAVLRDSFPDLEIEIFDGIETSAATRLYAAGERTPAERARELHPFSKVDALTVAGHPWTTRVTARSSFYQAIDRQKAQIVLLAGSLISLLFFGVVRALAARREYALTLAEEMTAALRQSERKFESLVESASEFSIIATDLDGLIQVFSVGAERLLGYRADEMVGRQTPAVIHLASEVEARGAELSAELGRPVQGFDVFIARARHDVSEAREWTYVRKDGSTLPVHLVVSAVHGADGAITGFLGVAHDITGQRQMQSSLLAAKDQAEAASRAKSEFVANMSHEIRTPMNAVLGMTYLLGTTELSPDQQQYLGMIRVSGQALLSILNDILDFSKIEAGRMEFAPAPFSLDAVLGAVATIMTVNAADKDLELAIGVEPDVPRALIGDALRLQQVLVNLAGNAVKFTARGEVSILVELVGRQGDTLQLRFMVRDSGIGMSVEQRARLFAPFAQADASTTRRFGGTGLGLAICKRLAGLMGGGIAVSSALGAGSEFSVTLPFQLDLDAPSAAAGIPHLRLLVVDDNMTSRDYLCKTIRAWGWQADSAASGVQALACLDAPQAYYDAVLVDWQMPQMDGLETMRQLRERAQLPVVIMTSAFGRGQLMQQAGAGEADAVLLKPVTASSMFDTLHEVLAQHGLGPAPLRAGLSGRRLEGARVLLVEDNPLNQVVARGMLEQDGAVVEVAGDGAQALERLREAIAAGTLYDLVLMDVQMPVMDGFAATAAIRAELGLTLPVIAMTAGVMPSERQHCLSAGMDDFIGKPIDVDQMFDTIGRHWRRAEPAATAPGAPERDRARDAAVAATPEPASAAESAAEAASAPAAQGGAAPARVFEPGKLMEIGKHDPAYRSTVLALVGRMADNAPGQLQEARQAWEHGRVTDAMVVLHKMRGSLGTVGAHRFAEAALAVESALRANLEGKGGGGGVDPLMRRATLELDAAVAAARLWLAQQEA